MESEKSEPEGRSRTILTQDQMALSETLNGFYIDFWKIYPVLTAGRCESAADGPVCCQYYRADYESVATSQQKGKIIVETLLYRLCMMSITINCIMAAALGYLLG